MKSSDQQKKANTESSADKKRIKKLERELARKEKALAEAVALLLPGKKSSQRFGGTTGKINPVAGAKKDHGLGSRSCNFWCTKTSSLRYGEHIDQDDAAMVR